MNEIKDLQDTIALAGAIFKDKLLDLRLTVKPEGQDEFDKKLNNFIALGMEVNELLDTAIPRQEAYKIALDNFINDNKGSILTNKKVFVWCEETQDLEEYTYEGVIEMSVEEFKYMKTFEEVILEEDLEKEDIVDYLIKNYY